MATGFADSSAAALAKAEDANIRRQRHTICQRVEDNAFHRRKFADACEKSLSTRIATFVGRPAQKESLLFVSQIDKGYAQFPIQFRTSGLFWGEQPSFTPQRVWGAVLFVPPMLTLFILFR